jgi:hypothetical protein
MKKKNNKQQLDEFETFIKDTFERKLPISVLDDGSLVYKRYLIKMDKNKKFVIFRFQFNSETEPKKMSQKQ